MVWAPEPTAKDCCTGAAAFQLASPAWLASMMQAPTASYVTVAPSVPEVEHTDVVALVKLTARSEVAVADRVAFVPTAAVPGPVKVMAWDYWTTS